MRLIDADALENAKAPVNGYWDGFARCFVYYPATWMQAFEVINKAPTIDAVPVVRCRECKHRYYYEEEDIAPVCTASMAYANTPDDWFCKGGERREEKEYDE